jgi:hypothetical protein
MSSTAFRPCCGSSMFRSPYRAPGQVRVKVAATSFNRSDWEGLRGSPLYAPRWAAHPHLTRHASTPSFRVGRKLRDACR